MYLFVWIPPYGAEIGETLCARVLKAHREGALEIERGGCFRLGKGLVERQSM